MEIAEVRDQLRLAPLRLVATRIKRARTKHAGLTLDQLADRIGSSRQHLIGLEQAKHRPRMDMLERIAEATGKPIDYFLIEEAGEQNPFPEAA